MLCAQRAWRIGILGEHICEVVLHHQVHTIVACWLKVIAVNDVLSFCCKFLQITSVSLTPVHNESLNRF